METRLELQRTIIELKKNKKDLPENLYLKVMNILMNKYIADAKAEDHRFVQCMQIYYDKNIRDILLKYVKRLPYENYYILIKERDLDEEEVDRMEIRDIIQERIYDVLPLQALKDIIDRYGGYAHVKNKIYSTSINNPEIVIERLNNMPELIRHKKMASFITDFQLYGYRFADVDCNHIDDEDVVELKTFLKILHQGMMICTTQK